MEILSQFCPGAYNDPLLFSLSSNGGPTPTMAVSSGSPAIGGISTGSCKVNGAVITTDQRGATRPSASGGNCTIGAYEYNVPEVPSDAVPPGVPIPFPSSGWTARRRSLMGVRWPAIGQARCDAGAFELGAAP
jgi:hypothetical protein